MTTDIEVISPADLKDPQYYFNRELSWLQFNDRVLHEALDDRTPLLERLKFSAIYSANLDEFFMVRISGLLEQVRAGVSRKTADGLSPEDQMVAIRRHLRPKLQQQQDLFATDLRSQLASHGVLLKTCAELNQAQQQYLESYFEAQIFPVLTPLSVDPAHPFPRLSNLSLNLAVAVTDPENGYSKICAGQSAQQFAPVHRPAGETASRYGEAAGVGGGVPRGCDGPALGLPLPWYDHPGPLSIPHHAGCRLPGAGG
jgi:polyphosphate kinase